MTALKQHYLSIQQRIKHLSQLAGVDTPLLLAVSKGRSVEQMRALLDCGQHHFAENYCQEAEIKIAELATLPVVWHFIGRLQSNKLKFIAQSFDWVHGLSTLAHAERLSAHRLPAQAPLKVCVQVNITGEATKSGVAEKEVAPLVKKINALDHLQVAGLMTMLPVQYDEEAQRVAFTAMRRLQQSLQRLYPDLQHLSMGMSRDYPQAIACGATCLRLGRILFDDSSIV